MANNLDLSIFVAGQALLDVGGWDASSLPFQTNGQFYYAITDGHAISGTPGPNETVTGVFTLLGAGI